MFEIIMENFSELYNWKNYNPTYFSIDSGIYLKGKGAGAAGAQTMEYHNSSILTPGKTYKLQWDLNWYGGVGMGWFDCGTGSGQYSFASQGTGYHIVDLVAGPNAYFKIMVGGPPGGDIFKLDYLRVYDLSTGKKVLINNPPLTSLVNKGL